MAVGCGAQCAKILLIVFNIVFWLSGAALLGLGIWMFVDDNISNYIKVFKAFEEGGSFINYAAIVFICVGCFVLLVGFLGCCGAIKESKCMLGMYMFFLLVVMAAEITAAVFVLLFRNQIMDNMESEMTTLIKDRYGKTNDGTSEAFTEGLDYLHQELDCCGYNGIADFATSTTANPDSCCKQAINAGEPCPSNDYFDTGCKDKIEDFVKENSVILMVVGFCVAGIEIFGFIFAVCLCRNVGEED